MDAAGGQGGVIEVEELLARKGLKTNHTLNRPLNNL